MVRVLAGNDPVCDVLRQQYERAQVVKRELTGGGFYSYFEVPREVDRLAGRPTFQFGDVIATFHESPFTMGFLLWIEEGAISMLEGYTFGEAVPEKVASFHVDYANGVRDWVEIRRNWESARSHD